MGSRTRQILTKDIRIITANAITRPNDTTTYAAGDALADASANAHFTFPQCLDRGVKTGEIVSAKLLCSSYVATGPDIDLMLFSVIPGTDADNAQATITDAEMANLIGVINFATGSWKPGTNTSGAGGNQAQFVKDVNIPIKLPILGGSDFTSSIFGFPILRNAYVPVAQEIYTCQLYIRQD